MPQREVTGGAARRVRCAQTGTDRRGARYQGLRTRAQSWTQGQTPHDKTARPRARTELENSDSPGLLWDLESANGCRRGGGEWGSGEGPKAFPFRRTWSGLRALGPAEPSGGGERREHKDTQAGRPLSSRPSTKTRRRERRGCGRLGRRRAEGTALRNRVRRRLPRSRPERQEPPQRGCPKAGTQISQQVE